MDAGIAGDKNQLAFLRRLLGSTSNNGPREPVVVFIDAEESDVEIVARVFEIIGIASEERGAFSGAKTSRTSVYFL